METHMKYCTYTGCNREAEVIKNTLCRRHYYHSRKEYFVVERELHGLFTSEEYGIWLHMKDRCFNKNNESFKNYGGRGIRVCQRWNKSFTAFLNDLGNRPSKIHSIDRIDNNGNYSCGKCGHCKALGWKSNVRWANPHEQRMNQRMRSDNRTGHENISFDKARNRYALRIRRFGAYVFNGRYDTLNEAIVAKENFLKEYHGS